MSASEPLYRGKSTYQLSWEKKITYSFVLYIKKKPCWCTASTMTVYNIDSSIFENNNSHLEQVLLVSHIAWARRGKYNTTLNNYLNRRWALHCQNVMTRYLHVTLYRHEWPRENLSLQYQCNIKHRSDENKVKYQLGEC